MRTGIRCLKRMFVSMAFAAAVGAADVPLDLPRPDGKPGVSTKPVKVYILTGQSNMVGFGRYTGNAPYDGVFLTADKAVIPGPVQFWPPRYLIKRHAIFQSAGADAPEGAIARLYEGDVPAAITEGDAEPIKKANVSLGAFSAKLPTVDGPSSLLVTAWIEVPETGNYEIHAGYGDSAYNSTLLDGAEVYRREMGGAATIKKAALAKGKRYQVQITYFRAEGGSAAFWLEQKDVVGKGDLTNVTKTEGAFAYLLDEEGKWSVRQDVTFAEARVAKEGRWEPLSATANGKHMGPELGFGYVVGHWHDEQVLLIKTAMGNRSISSDFRPPSSGVVDKESKYEGLEYKLTVEGVQKILEKIADVVPGYQGQGYEMAGLVWWQGHKDRGQTKEQYKQNLVNLIQDLRKAFDAPEMPAVIATVAFDGYDMIPEYMEIWKAQMAVGDPTETPEMAGTAKTVDARGFWYSRDESPTGTGYHYNHNAKTYMLVGDALGRAMVELQGGTAEPRPVPNQPNNKKMVEEVGEPTAEQLAAHKVAIGPLVMDGMIPLYVNNPANRQAIDDILAGKKPERTSFLPRDAMDFATWHYSRLLGISDYEWKPVVPDMMNGEWDYYTCEGKLPADMNNWFASDFDAKAAGWKTGKAPFGNAGGKKVALRNCNQAYCNCGTEPGTFWDKPNLYMRQTFSLPPVREGHRYRIVVGGASHVMSGSPYTVYVNGRALKGGAVPNRRGGQPRGNHIYDDILAELKTGTVTIGVTSSLRMNARPSPRGHLSVNLEMQKLPSLD